MSYPEAAEQAAVYASRVMALEQALQKLLAVCERNVATRTCSLRDLRAINQARTLLAAEKAPQP